MRPTHSATVGLTGNVKEHRPALGSVIVDATFDDVIAEIEAMIPNLAFTLTVSRGGKTGGGWVFEAGEIRITAVTCSRLIKAIKQTF